MAPVRCGASAVAGTAGRRRLRVPMPATWASTTAFSPEWPAKRPMGAVFSCVASRNTQRVFYWPGGREKAGRLFAVQPPTKVRPCAHPPEAALRPGRRGRAMQGIATSSENILRPKLGRDLTMTATFLRALPPQRGGRPTPPPGGRPVPLSTRKLGFSLNNSRKLRPFLTW
jgi:hypothetical protein